jgi:aspartyl-tRNA(Asn)/glutamyl-tRNA(Gln) amidotransferase subunit C
VSWIEQLGEVDTSDVAPMSSVVAHVLSQRVDAVTDGGYADAVTRNAADRIQLGDGAFFVVPKVIE